MYFDNLQSKDDKDEAIGPKEDRRFHRLMSGPNFEEAPAGLGNGIRIRHLRKVYANKQVF